MLAVQQEHLNKDDDRPDLKCFAATQTLRRTFQAAWSYVRSNPNSGFEYFIEWANKWHHAGRKLEEDSLPDPDFLLPEESHDCYIWRDYSHWSGCSLYCLSKLKAIEAVK